MMLIAMKMMMIEAAAHFLQHFCNLSTETLLVTPVTKSLHCFRWNRSVEALLRSVHAFNFDDVDDDVDEG